MGGVDGDGSGLVALCFDGDFDVMTRGRGARWRVAVGGSVEVIVEFFLIDLFQTANGGDEPIDGEWVSILTNVVERLRVEEE